MNATIRINMHDIATAKYIVVADTPDKGKSTFPECWGSEASFDYRAIKSTNSLKEACELAIKMGYTDGESSPSMADVWDGEKLLWIESYQYTVDVRSECGSSDKYTIYADDSDDAESQAEELAEEYLRDGEWGQDGASVSAWYTVTDSDGEEVATGSVTVEIDPDLDAKLKDAIDGDSIEDFCGYDDDDHDWVATVEIDGGLKENPGVFSKGGTAMVFYRHCDTCGIKRKEYHCGSQRNPGEHDTVDYAMPDGEFE